VTVVLLPDMYVVCGFSMVGGRRRRNVTTMMTGRELRYAFVSASAAWCSSYAYYFIVVSELLLRRLVARTLSFGLCTVVMLFARDKGLLLFRCSDGD
jgi:hypothetical protein